MLALILDKQRRVFLLPVSPALGVDNSSIRQRHQKFTRLIFDIDQIIDQQRDLFANVLTLKTMDGYRCLWHDVNVSR
jgi:hypothetical protein